MIIVFTIRSIPPETAARARAFGRMATTTPSTPMIGFSRK
jgi:hypothetical protein